jgi:hypothetical protein
MTKRELLIYAVTVIPTVLLLIGFSIFIYLQL